MEFVQSRPALQRWAGAERLGPERKKAPHPTATGPSLRGSGRGRAGWGAVGVMLRRAQATRSHCAHSCFGGAGELCLGSREHGWLSRTESDYMDDARTAHATGAGAQQRAHSDTGGLLSKGYSLLPHEHVRTATSGKPSCCLAGAARCTAHQVDHVRLQITRKLPSSHLLSSIWACAGADRTANRVAFAARLAGAALLAQRRRSQGV